MRLRSGSALPAAAGVRRAANGLRARPAGALREASRAAAPLRAGLTATSARQAVGRPRARIATPALAVPAGGGRLAWRGPGGSGPRGAAPRHAAAAPRSARTTVLGPR